MSDFIRAQQPALSGLLMPVADEPDLIDQEYADDTLLFLHHSHDVLDTIQYALEVFCIASSARINWDKSYGILAGSDDVPTWGPGDFTWLRPGETCTLQHLSLAGRALVANQVLLASAWYVASCWTLHGGVMRQFRQLIRNFLYGGSDGTHDTRARVRWSTVIMPTSQGGLGIIDPEMQSRVLLTKLIVRGLFPGNEPWKMLLQSDLATVTPTYGVRDGYIWTPGMRFLFTDAPVRRNGVYHFFVLLWYPTDWIVTLQTWDALKLLDAADSRDPEASSEIIEIYAQKAVSQENEMGEHLWPSSYGLKRGQPEFTDLHNLRPADANVNSARGKKYFGECMPAIDKACLMPAFREAASDTATSKRFWTPPLKTPVWIFKPFLFFGCGTRFIEDVRGDIARSLMYMVVRYGPNNHGKGSYLQLSDAPHKGKAEMGELSILLQWNMEDPPSSEERLRNFRVCALFQHNRNPFVDHPEFASQIWDAEYIDH
ncbi:hypothetical protein L7F22_062668 [Adiantum nelumboides]|nr:hypothetical protein [Adiantum nelumboides]